jgi:hypothetical protein
LGEKRSFSFVKLFPFFPVFASSLCLLYFDDGLSATAIDSRTKVESILDLSKMFQNSGLPDGMFSHQKSKFG